MQFQQTFISIPLSIDRHFDLHKRLYLYVAGHDDKPNIVKYHPTANGVLASSSLDLTVKIWDISKAKDLITLNGHTEQVGTISKYVM